MKEQLEIHSENILPIIKKQLYSSRDIFLRELVSNAQDACEKLRLLNVATKEPFRIDVRIRKEDNILEIEDNGIGMSPEEVKKYIAKIAFSGAEEFMEHYKTDDTKDQLIGHFGLGFYSSYMVASLVEIESLSYKGGPSAHWRCDGSSSYDLEEGSKTTQGTKILLHIDQDSKEYLEEATLRNLLKTYCSFLPIPIYLNEKRINEVEPLWQKSPSSLTDKDYLEFYQHLYPLQPKPLFWVHLQVDFPFHVQGILYFPEVTKRFDTQKANINLYCNRVFVAENCKDLLPDYLTALQGVLDSPDLPLNVSRSSLQTDRTVKQLAAHISKKVSDKLKEEVKKDKDGFAAIFETIAPIIKLGCLEDEKFFDRTKEALLFTTTKDEVLSCQELEEEAGEKIYYTHSKHVALPLIRLFEEKEKKVFVLDSPLDSYLLSLLEKKLSPKTFHRIDSNIDEAFVDPSKEHTVLDEQGRTAAAHSADFFRKQLDNVEVEAKSLSSTSLPGFVLWKEEERRMQEAFATMQPELQGSLPPLPKTFVINTNSPLIKHIERIGKKDASLAKELSQEVFDLSLLSQKEMDRKGLEAFVERSQKLLETLAEKV